ncbi:MAG: hypothetical protein WBZ48_11490 [Bacteroidota bacterium]
MAKLHVASLTSPLAGLYHTKSTMYTVAAKITFFALIDRVLGHISVRHWVGMLAKRSANAPIKIRSDGGNEIKNEELPYAF